jgi:hypothetical protein
MSDAPRYGTKTVSVLPRHFRAHLKLFNAHFGGTKNDVLPVIKFPIARQDAILGHESFVERRVGKRCHDGITGQVNVRLHGELGRFEKHIRFVMVEAEHKAALQRNTVFVESLDDPRKFVG